MLNVIGNLARQLAGLGVCVCVEYEQVALAVVSS